MSRQLLRSTLFRSRDSVTRFEYAGCRVSVVRCTDTLDAVLKQWKWFAQQDTDRETLTRTVEKVLGPLMACTVMNNSFLKGQERTQGILSVEKQTLAAVEATRTGEIRARFPPSLGGKLELTVVDQEPIFLDVKKVLYGNAKPFISSVRLTGKEKFEMTFGEANLFPGVMESLWNHFYMQSEQIPSIAFSKTVVAEDGKVVLCAGVTIQGLNQESVDEFDELPEEKVLDLRDSLCDNGNCLPRLESLKNMNGAEWWNSVLNLDGTDEALTIPERGEDSKVDAYRVDMFCPCSAERFAHHLTSSISEDELDSFFTVEGEKQESFTVNCEFCNSEHQITKEILAKVAPNLASK